MSQYFDLFNLPATFALDNATLDARYRAVAAQCHPDKFAARSAFEQKQAMMMSTTVNEAYRTLKDPHNRAAYLLQAQGIEADAPEHTQFAPAFLMQQMDWRETLAEARAAADETALNNLAAEIHDAQTALYRRLNTAFADNTPAEAAALVREGRFLNKLQQEIQAALP